MLPLTQSTGKIEHQISIIYNYTFPTIFDTTTDYTYIITEGQCYAYG